MCSGTWLNQPVVGTKPGDGSKPRPSACYMDRADTMVVVNSIVQAIFVIVYVSGVAVLIGALNDLGDFLLNYVDSEDSRETARGFNAVTGSLANLLYAAPIGAMLITGVLLLFTLAPGLAKDCRAYFLVCCVPTFNVIFSISFGVFSLTVAGVTTLLMGPTGLCDTNALSVDEIIARDPDLVNNAETREVLKAIIDICQDAGTGLNLMTAGVVVIEISLWTAVIVSCIRGNTLRQPEEKQVYNGPPQQMVIIQQQPGQPIGQVQQPSCQPMGQVQQQPTYATTGQPIAHAQQQPTYSYAANVQPMGQAQQQPMYATTGQPMGQVQQQPTYATTTHIQQQPTYNNTANGQPMVPMQHQQPMYATTGQPMVLTQQKPSYASIASGQPMTQSHHQPTYSTTDQVMYQQAEPPQYEEGFGGGGDVGDGVGCDGGGE